MGSELWFREYERLLNQKMDAGKSFREANAEAATEAAPNIRERYFEAADRARKIAKGE